jgi:hypothetical protein
LSLPRATRRSRTSSARALPTSASSVSIRAAWDASLAAARASPATRRASVDCSSVDSDAGAAAAPPPGTTADWKVGMGQVCIVFFFFL